MSTKTQNPAQELTEAQLIAELQKRKAEKKSNREAYKEMVKEVVPNVFADIKHASSIIAIAKTEIFKNLADLLELKKDAYATKDNQQSHTFSDEHGHSITIGFRVTDGWDDTVGAGIEKVNAFIESLAKDVESAKLVKTINSLLKKDAKNNLKANRVVELYNMAADFNNPLFTDGVEIIRNAYKPVRSVCFIEASHTDKNGFKNGVPLSMSSVEFTEELNINL